MSRISYYVFLAIVIRKNKVSIVRQVVLSKRTSQLIQEVLDSGACSPDPCMLHAPEYGAAESCYYVCTQFHWFPYKMLYKGTQIPSMYLEKRAAINITFYPPF